MAIAGFQKVGVIGAGQMGSGIAQVAAMFGLDVTLVDVQEAQLKRAEQGIAKSADKLSEKGKIDAGQRKAIADNLSFSGDLKALKDVDIVIEAIIENENIKRELFENLDKILKPEAVIASNTSSIPITRLASYTKRPEQVIGMHFMNPVPIMKLVEIITGMATSEDVAKRVNELAIGMGKEISVSQDYPGFVVNRVLMPMINEAFFALMEGVASAEDIDKGMKLGCNLPMGPLTLADFIGLDTCFSIMNVIHQGTGDSKHRPCPLLAKYVEAGFYGRKTGKGVYSY